MKCILSFLGTLAIGLTATAAPICSQVVLREDFYVASLNDVARMKLEVDLAMTDGRQNTSMMTKVNEGLYSQKYTELVLELSKRFSKKEINAMLRARISELQAEGKDKDVRNKEARHKERRMLNQGQFEFVDRIELPYVFAETDNVVEIIPGTDSFLINNGIGETYLFSHRNKSSVNLKKGMGIVKLIPGTQAIAIIKDSIQIYDVQTESIVREIPFVGSRPSLPSNSNIGGIDPSGRYLAFVQNGLKMIDIQSGEILSFPQAKKTVGDTIKELLFINDHELIIGGLDIEYRSQAVAVLDVKTGTAKSIPGTIAADNFTLVAEGRTVLIALKKIKDGSEKFALYDTKDVFADPVVMSRALFRRDQLAHFMPISQSNLVSLEREQVVNSRKEPSFEVYDIKDLNQLIFKFDKYKSPSEVTAQGFAPEADAAFFLYREPNSNKRFLDIWTAK